MTSFKPRFLKALSSSPPPTLHPNPNPEAVDSDFVVILAALLCALICVLGLVAVARCAWLRRFSAAAGGGGINSPYPAANKGLKKKVLNSLPKVPYSPDNHTGKLSDECAICLSEFTTGEQIRVLPQCGHNFHVTCIDTWLGSHSSCPSCRQILAVRCQKCGGGLHEAAAAGATTTTSSAGNLVSLPPEAPMESRDNFLP